MPTSVFPKGYRPKTRGGVQALKPCLDCPSQTIFEYGKCPGITLLKEAYTIFSVYNYEQFHNVWHPDEQSALEIYSVQTDRAKVFGCEGKKHYVHGTEEFMKVLDTTFHSNEKEK